MIRGYLEFVKILTLVMAYSLYFEHNFSENNKMIIRVLQATWLHVPRKTENIFQNSRSSK